MRTYECTCGNRLFFENTQCLSCGLDVGWCPACRSISPLLPTEKGNGAFLCGRPECQAELFKCSNYTTEGICNWCLAPGITPGIMTPGIGGGSLPLCGSCRLTAVIPDLSIDGNRKRWFRLEAAKRRLLCLLDLLKLPYGRAEDGVSLPLSFFFKADAIPANGVWRTMTHERVYTGHQDGRITINVREADDAEREKLRVDMNEAHRTLCGHFRHEIGHYYWQMLIPGQLDQQFKNTFGDYEQPAYAAALEAYYRNGPPPNWQARFISAYAAMHPWEDFAETFALYLDLAAVLDTAGHATLVPPIDVCAAELDDMISRYLELGVTANELNRSMGLIDLVPEILSPAVRIKLAFVHHLVRECRSLHVQPETATCETVSCGTQN